MRARFRDLNPSPNSGTNLADSVGKISSPYLLTLATPYAEIAAYFTFQVLPGRDNLAGGNPSRSHTALGRE